MKYKVLIVDDEEPARDLLRNYAEKLDELEVVATLPSALSAKKLLSQTKVDILLTDIQMEDLTGIELLQVLQHPPTTIFTTAYSEYALEGYALDVVDYLVKPISFQRFCQAINRAKELIDYKSTKGPLLEPISEGHQPKEDAADYFFVKTNRKIVRLNYADLLFVESYGEYVKLYTKEDIILALQTTSFMEQMLPASDFVRIHRSHIVNLSHIREIDGNEVYLDEYRLVVSKRMKEGFLARIREKGMI
ncbi:MAG: LytTR family DNA-binding domain-containing protein [Saprospiraceae bacterium]|nr:LytTR family DNA-binding domain-containing protein [Saprospiraceae bacterium]